MEVFVGWFLFSLVVAGIAVSRGRSGFGWFVLSLLLSPLICGIALFVMPDEKAAQGLQQAAQKQEAVRTQEALVVSGLSVANELLKIANLKKIGVINEGELNVQKETFFQQLSSRKTRDSLGDFFMPIGNLLSAGEITVADLNRLKMIYSSISQR